MPKKHYITVKKIPTANKPIDAKNYVYPTLNNNMQNVYGESLMLFGTSTHKGKQYRLFYGIGEVYRITKGEKSDLVYVNFGIWKNNRPRLVICYGNHARRQILTLKRGQMCQVYGFCKFYKEKVSTKVGDTTGIKMSLFAQSILGWYLPSIMEIRKMPKNSDMVDPTEKEKLAQQKFDDLLDSFLSGKGEDWDL
jgi:hypothetical protein